MGRRRSEESALLLLGALDLAVTAASWVAAYHLRWSTRVLAPVDGVPPLWWCLRTLPLVLLAALVSYRITGLYRRGSRRSFGREIACVLQASVLLVLLVLATTFYAQNVYASRAVFLLFGGATAAALLAVRQGMGLYFVLRRRAGVSDGSALIVGAGRAARAVESTLRSSPWLGVAPVGFVDDGAPRPGRPATVGSIDDLPGLVESHRIDHVYIALPWDRVGQTRRIYRLLANTLAEIHVVPDVPPTALLGVTVEDLSGTPVLNLRPPPHGLPQVVLKRAMDVALSAVGLVVLSPLLGLIALAVKLSDRGPILYRQERMGLNGHRFWMYKFRSMRVGAEDGTGPVWAREGDERRTGLGAFLRSTSLDELPQLYNVLIGDMSLVGPRPERPFFIEHFRRSIPRYMLRHAVKAGITGWAQVNGWRGNTSLRKRVQYDLYYIANWSIWLDLRILFATIFRAMWDKNAY